MTTLAALLLRGDGDGVPGWVPAAVLAFAIAGPVVVGLALRAADRRRDGRDGTPRTVRLADLRARHAAWAAAPVLVGAAVAALMGVSPLGGALIGAIMVIAGSTARRG